MTDEQPYPLAYLGRQLEALPRHSRDVRMAVLQPADSSPALNEHAALTDAQRPYWNDLITSLHLRLSLAEEALAAVGKLLPDWGIVYGHYPVIRSVVELSARVCWLLDPTISGAVRMRRAVGDRIDSVKEVRELNAPGAHEWGKGRLRDVQSRAQAAGLQHINPPSRTASAAAAMADESDDPDGRLGHLAYQVLSAPAHGTMYGLMRFVRPILDEEGKRIPTGFEGQYQASLTKDPSDDATAVLMGLLPYQRAMSRWQGWTGHTLDDWQSYVTYVSWGFRQHMSNDES